MATDEDWMRRALERTEKFFALAIVLTLVIAMAAIAITARYTANHPDGPLSAEGLVGELGVENAAVVAVTTTAVIGVEFLHGGIGGGLRAGHGQEERGQSCDPEESSQEGAQLVASLPPPPTGQEGREEGSMPTPRRDRRALRPPGR